MVYEQITKLEAADISALRKDIDPAIIPMGDSTVVYRIKRDDETRIAIVGLVRPFVMALEHMIWLAPMEELRPLDLRGMKRLLKVLREYCPYATAVEGDERGIRLLRACDFQPQERYGNMRIYKWL